MDKRLRILYEDDAILVCDKKAGMAVQSKKIGNMDLESLAKVYLMKKSGNKKIFLAAVHRLDQPVEGIVLFAKDKKAAADLSKQFSEHTVEKYYMAVVEGRFEGEEGQLTDYLIHDAKSNTSYVSTDPGKGKESRLAYRVLKDNGDKQLLEIHLLSGRHHQIRVQLSHAGHAIVGDKCYNPNYEGAQARLYPALCACRLTITHPVSKNKICFKKEPDGEAFKEFL